MFSKVEIIFCTIPPLKGVLKRAPLKGVLKRAPLKGVLKRAPLKGVLKRVPVIWVRAYFKDRFNYN
ncbi:MAG: glutamate-rich protein 5 [Proteobacteria bacterium]|nr:glutamate-rich protein 5 [Pseudomonadota bacterium]